MEEKKEFLQRQDIKTMAKDVTQTREEQAGQERERIAGLKPAQESAAQGETSPRQPLGQTPSRPQSEPQLGAEKGPTPLSTAPPPAGLPSFEEKITPVFSEKAALPVPPRPSRPEKLLIRTGIVLILVLIFANIFLFWYWYLRKEGGPVIPAAPEEQPETIPPEEQPEETPEVVPPVSLIPIEASSFLQATGTQNLSAVISQALKTGLRQGHTRLLIQNAAGNKITGLKEFFAGFGITAPDGFYAKLDNDFTLFIFSQEQGNRLGFVAKIIEKQGLAELLASWEATMESDFEKLFVLLGKKGPALASFFKDVPYRGATLSYQTFSRDDLGICYGIFSDYLVWTSSWESLLKTIDKISG